MTLAPIQAAPIEIQIHVIGAVIALLIGPFSIWRKRRDRLHKTLGVLWIGSMLVLAISSFFIHGFRMVGPFSPIHLLSILVLHDLWKSIAHLRARRFAAHGKTMKSLYFTALVLAGFFTLLPGRRMSDVLFGQYQIEGFFAALVLVSVAILWLRFGRHRTAV